MSDTAAQEGELVRAPADEGIVEIRLDPHWVREEAPGILRVHVKRYEGQGDTALGRIDFQERTYHLLHHSLADFVRWSEMSTTLGIEELRLAAEHGCLWIDYLDELNSKQYRITLERARKVGVAKRRERIGWRWVVGLDEWESLKSVKGG